VAHEVRNPLTGIAAGVQWLARALANDAPQRENLDFILSEIKRLDRIVQDLFDITHPRGLQMRTAPLEETISRALHSLEALLRERDITVRLDVAPSTPAVPFDADQMQQVFINLIKNAAEASPAGAGIRVHVATAHGRGRGSKPGRVNGVVARVEDQGSGISPDHLKTVFEPFFTTRQGGTGLGLYICHDIVRRHGGSLTVQSEPGGSIFTVDLPLEAHEEPPSKANIPR
jgi:signal transduction histidine kinase